MSRLPRFIAQCALGLAVLLGSFAAARADDQQEIVDRAKITVDSLRSDPNFAQPIGNLLKRAKAVVIFPSLFKAGFIIGGEGGSGVLLVKGTDGMWSAPAFYGMGSGSIGLQIGAQSSEVMLLVMTEGGLQKLMSSSLKLGADLSVAVGPVGAGVEASTTANLGQDIYAYSKNAGLFGGGALEGSVISGRDSWNKVYYGNTATARGIVLDRQFDNPGSLPLRDALAR